MADVTILMGVYNGAAHLDEQLTSFTAQTAPHWRLIAGDDGSTDASRDILARFAARRAPGQVQVVDGPGRGRSAPNYLALLRHLPEAPGHVAFSDQDDIWLPDRLERGLAALEGIEGPALHAGRTWVASEDMTRRRLSRGCPRPPGFRHALVQNVAAGNTILANPEAARLLREAALRHPEVVVHDWWAYQLITGAGGRLLFDDRPLLLYRQHDGNSIGANDGIMAKLRRLGMLADGTMRRWMDTNLAALQTAKDLLEPEARALMDELADLRRDKSPLRRLARLRALGLYRQTRSSTLALWLAALTGRL